MKHNVRVLKQHHPRRSACGDGAQCVVWLMVVLFVLVAPAQSQPAAVVTETTDAPLTRTYVKLSLKNPLSCCSA
jgi:hypothetical protein